MAVREFTPAKSKFKIKYKKTYLVIFVLFICVSVFCIGVRINNDAVIAEYNEEIAVLQEKVDTISKENDEYLAALNSSDKSAYYEKIAREVYGYAKPGEYVFYKAES